MLLFLTKERYYSCMKVSNRSLYYVFAQIVLLVLIIFGPDLITFNSKNVFLDLFGLFFILFGIYGVLVASFSIRTSLSIFPDPKKGAKLAQGGLYKYVRHPIYSSVLFFSLGVVLIDDSYFKLILLVLLYVLFYYKSIFEEELLSKKFKDYKEYARKTPRFIPFPKRS